MTKSTGAVSPMAREIAKMMPVTMPVNAAEDDLHGHLVGLARGQAGLTKRVRHASHGDLGRDHDDREHQHGQRKDPPTLRSQCSSRVRRGKGEQTIRIDGARHRLGDHAQRRRQLRDGFSEVDPYEDPMGSP